MLLCDFLQIPIDCNVMDGKREITQTKKKTQKKTLINCIFAVFAMVRGVLASV